jgi:hypothetical protein
MPLTTSTVSTYVPQRESASHTADSDSHPVGRTARNADRDVRIGDSYARRSRITSGLAGYPRALDTDDA